MTYLIARDRSAERAAGVMAAAERRGRMLALLDGMEKAGCSALNNVSLGYLDNARSDVGDVLASIPALRRYIEEDGTI